MKKKTLLRVTVIRVGPKSVGPDRGPAFENIFDDCLPRLSKILWIPTKETLKALTRRHTLINAQYSPEGELFELPEASLKTEEAKYCDVIHRSRTS